MTGQYPWVYPKSTIRPFVFVIETGADDRDAAVPTRVPKGKVLLTVAIDPDLREAAKLAAQKEEVTLTVFVTRALRERVGSHGDSRSARGTRRR